MRKLISVFLLSILSFSIYSEELVYRMFQGDNDSGVFNLNFNETSDGNYSVKWDSQAVFKMLVSINYNLSGNCNYAADGSLIESFVNIDAGSFGKHQLKIQI